MSAWDDFMGLILFLQEEYYYPHDECPEWVHDLRPSSAERVACDVALWWRRLPQEGRLGFRDFACRWASVDLGNWSHDAELHRCAQNVFDYIRESLD